MVLVETRTFCEIKTNSAYKRWSQLHFEFSWLKNIFLDKYPPPWRFECIFMYENFYDII